MLSDFRSAGANAFDPNKTVELYFIAQHYGMPTRLLDWTINPLAALFFAVGDGSGEDGDIFVMSPKRLLPDISTVPGATADFPRDVATMRHPYVTHAVGVSFWVEPDDRPSLILPVRPDNQPGRIAQQNSCFTLHMHRCYPLANPTLAQIKVDGASKPALRDELERMGINEFSIYCDLDNLSKVIRRSYRMR
jgi:hypothetical protein